MLPASALFVARTAAWMHRLDIEPASPIQVALPPTAKSASRTGLQVRHIDVGGDITLIEGIRATSLERTLMDLCVELSAVEAVVALDMSIRARRTSKDLLRRYASSRAGRPGAARLRRLAELAAPAESPMETRLRWVLLEAGLPSPEVQTDLHDDDHRFVGRADLYFPSAHLIVEFDGGTHRDRLVGDDRRQNLLVGAGYRILRFTAADVYGRPEMVASQVRAAIAG